MDDEYKIKRELASRNCIFEFNEILNFKAELEILKKVESYLEEFGTPQFLRTSYFVLNEIIQNSFMHCVKNTENKLIIGQTEDEIIIVCENIISLDQKQKLIDKICPLNEVCNNENEIKRIYKAKLNEGSRCNEKGGAGLGFISIIRKTRNKLLYHFSDVDNKHSIFSLVTTIEINRYSH